MTFTCYRIRVTRSRINSEWLCRLVPIGASPYDDSAILVGRYPSQPEAVTAGWTALSWAQTPIKWMIGA